VLGGETRGLRSTSERGRTRQMQGESGKCRRPRSSFACDCGRRDARLMTAQRASGRKQKRNKATGLVEKEYCKSVSAWLLVKKLVQVAGGSWSNTRYRIFSHILIVFRRHNYLFMSTCGAVKK